MHAYTCWIWASSLSLSTVSPEQPLTEPGTIWLATCPSNPVPIPNPSSEVTRTHDHTDFYVGSGDLNLGPYVLQQDSYLPSHLPTTA